VAEGKDEGNGFLPEEAGVAREAVAAAGALVVGELAQVNMNVLDFHKNRDTLHKNRDTLHFSDFLLVNSVDFIYFTDYFIGFFIEFLR